MGNIIMAITGASGSPYAKRLFDLLVDSGKKVDVILSDVGKAIWTEETGCSVNYFTEKGASCYDNKNFYSPCASGSSLFQSMIIIPSSMGTLGRIANGVSESLITRTAEVTLKERRRLIIVPRETPYSYIHLKNMMTLTKAGAIIMPASPGFYHKPTSVDQIVDFIAARAMDLLGVKQEVVPQWNPGL
jgi:4-hydroxy-3-polyprenylbenzoate decarboxylase